MDLCTQTSPFDASLDEVLAYVESLGFESIDLKATGTGPATIHPDDYLDDEDEQAELLGSIERHDLNVSVLGAGGMNPLHPDEERAGEADELLRKIIRLADQLGVDTVTSFAGLPGGSPDDVTPNWITAVPPFPELAEAYAYQWEDVTVPYWRDLAEFADAHDVDIALEIHINMIVSSPVDLLHLRRETNDRIGGYLDPGHLILQRIDPIEGIRTLATEGANHHFEASDVRFERARMDLQGTTDMTASIAGEDPAWSFCTVGYGELSENHWRRIIATLDDIGYDGAVSIQQLNTPEPFRRGLERAAAYLDTMLL